MIRSVWLWVDHLSIPRIGADGFKQFGADRFERLVSKAIAPAEVFGNKALALQKRIINFYLDHNDNHGEVAQGEVGAGAGGSKSLSAKDKDKDHKFILEKYNEVSGQLSSSVTKIIGT